MGMMPLGVMPLGTQAPGRDASRCAPKSALNKAQPLEI